MAYKTVGYYKTKEGFTKVHRDEICQLKIEDQVIFRDDKKPFYLEPSDDGPRMTYNTKNRTFSFLGIKDSSFIGSNEESATHKYCIEEISKLEHLRVWVGPKDERRPVDFKFNYIFSEIVLPVGGKLIKPDLLIYLREPYDLALKWNRILAVEIVVTHKFNGEKLELMKRYKIPILRIKVGRKWGTDKIKDMSEAKKEILRKKIKEAFRKGHSADFLLDQKYKAYLENHALQESLKENSMMQNIMRKYKTSITQKGDQITSLKSELETSNDTIKHFREELKKTNYQATELKRQISEVKQRKLNMQKYLAFSIGLLIITVFLMIMYIEHLQN